MSEVDGKPGLWATPFILNAFFSILHILLFNTFI